jgi:hypothetical protein
LTGTSDSHPPECVIPDDVLTQFGPPDDEHLLLETCRGISKYIKECVKLVINQKTSLKLFHSYKFLMILVAEIGNSVNF